MRKNNFRLASILASTLALGYFVLKPTEREELARVMHAEAGNQPRVVRRLVGKTIGNRTHMEGYSHNIRDVIHQPRQFSSVGGRLWKQTMLPAWFGYSGSMNPVERKVYRECLEDAEMLMAGEKVGLAGEERVEAFYSGKKPNGKYWENMQTLYSNGTMSFCARRK